MKSYADIKEKLKEHHEMYNFLKYRDQYPDPPACFKRLPVHAQLAFLENAQYMAQMERAAIYTLEWILDVR